MPIKYQGGAPLRLYYGADEVEAIYYGSTQIWPTHPNLEAVAGGYALSGKAATLRRARKLLATAGVFARSGQAANFVRTRVMAAMKGSFVLTGQAVTMIVGRPFLGEVGSFALSGQAALRRSRTFPAAAGVFGLTGQAAALNYSGGGYAFNVTAGTDGSNVGYVASNYGSIDAEPVPAHALETCVYFPLPAVALSFSGDAVSLLAGKHLWVGGVDHGLPQDVGAGADWQYDSDGSLTGAPAVTFGYWLTGYPTFVNGNSYFVEIK